MKTIRIYLPWDDQRCPPLLRQTPGSLGIWKNIQFDLNGGFKHPDYVVVFAGQTSRISEPIPKEHSLFIAGEPPAIKKYSDNYLAQFGAVICSDPSISHPNKIIAQQGYPWFCGLKFMDNGQKVSVKSYDDYKNETPINKTKLLSVVCSDKQSKPGHQKRYRFVQKLKQVFGDQLDLYGNGQNPIADKADAIRPYQYHIAIENSNAPHYWSEKISDCYLEESFPFYAGCENLQDYFPEDSYAAIDLDNPEATVLQIKRAIESDQHARSLKAIQEAKARVLDEYNLFNVIAEHFENLKKTDNNIKTTFSAYPSKWFTKGLRYKTKFKISEIIHKASSKRRL